ncbi:hypothetical protein ADK64_36830 [Streptomyces sp. MMG1121]|nr:hypothetical protein ADK64_36830 [Streptomyces sp. MMG1121]
MGWTARATRRAPSGPGAGSATTSTVECGPYGKRRSGGSYGGDVMAGGMPFNQRLRHRSPAPDGRRAESALR